MRKYKDLPQMTERQAHNVKHRMKSTDGWDELANNFPNFKKAVESLPDYKPLRLCNPMLQDMLSDAIKDEVKKCDNIEEYIYNVICHYISGSHQEDFTPKRIAKWMLGDVNKNYFIIQSRLSGLKNKDKIERTGEKRDGCATWKLL